MSRKLWHCGGARSLRVLWTLEELGLDYELVVLPFPPRLFDRAFLDINSLGTVPYFTQGDVEMTESVAICQYLAERDPAQALAVAREDAQYAAYLNWLQHADATLTFPQTIVLRYTYLEPGPEKTPIAEDYARWFIARLRRLDAHLESHDYLVDERFTVADIAVGYALYLGPQTRDYLERLLARPALQRADAMAPALDL